MTDIGKREDGVGRDSREHTERVAHALPVAVVTPVYNRAELLARALEGVAEQQRPPAEVIVVDDCSTDD
nr:glycosyltransferase [Actinomycetota bacterium]